MKWHYGTELLPECLNTGIDFDYGDCSGSYYDTAEWSDECYIYVPKQNEIVLARLVTFQDSELGQEWMSWGFISECTQQVIEVKNVSAWMLRSDMHATLQHPIKEQE